MNHRHADFQSSRVAEKSTPYNSETVKPASKDQYLSGGLSNCDTRTDQKKTAATSGKVNGGDTAKLDGSCVNSNSTSARLAAIANDFDPFVSRDLGGNVAALPGRSNVLFEINPAIDEIDALIGLADGMATDCDLEDTGDGEPSLGWRDGGHGSERIFDGWTDLGKYTARHCLDLEDDAGDQGEADCDNDEDANDNPCLDYSDDPTVAQYASGGEVNPLPYGPDCTVVCEVQE